MVYFKMDISIGEVIRVTKQTGKKSSSTTTTTTTTTTTKSSYDVGNSSITPESRWRYEDFTWFSSESAVFVAMSSFYS